MRIIKSGKLKNKKIVCECECEFEYETQDILKDYFGSTYVLTTNPPTYPVTHYVNCPECGKKHVIYTTYEHQSITITSNLGTIKCNEE